MLSFIAGLFVGGVIGLVVMSLLVAARGADRDAGDRVADLSQRRAAAQRPFPNAKHTARVVDYTSFRRAG